MSEGANVATEAPEDGDLDLLGVGTSEPAAEGGAEPQDPGAQEPTELLLGKFKSPEALAEGYQELERAFHARTQPPSEYDLSMPEGIELGEEDYEWLKQGKFTNEQAQHVLDFFHNDILPTIQEAKLELHQERLGRSWGMEPSSQVFAQRLENIRAWAKENLPEGVVAEMAKSSNGVNALFELMQSQSAGKLSPGVASGQPAKPDEQALAELMADPRYQYDDDFKEHVRRQFQRAYD